MLHMLPIRYAAAYALRQIHAAMILRHAVSVWRHMLMFSPAPCRQILLPLMLPYAFALLLFSLPAEVVATLFTRAIFAFADALLMLRHITPRYAAT